MLSIIIQTSRGINGSTVLEGAVLLIGEAESWEYLNNLVGHISKLTRDQREIIK